MTGFEWSLPVIIRTFPLERPLSQPMFFYAALLHLAKPLNAEPTKRDEYEY